MINRLLACALALALAFPLLATAQPAPGHHPAYLHALTDLRDARWYLAHPPGDLLEERERHALGDIDRAIDEVQRAAYYDGKNVYERPRSEAYPERGRLRRVSDLLRKAREDVAQDEDNFQVREMQRHAVEHIDDAIRLAESVMVERERAYEYERNHEREHDHDHEHDRDHDRARDYDRR